MESYDEGYNSNGNFPCYNLQAQNEDPNNFEDTLLGGERSLITNIRDHTTNSNDSVGNMTVND